MNRDCKIVIMTDVNKTKQLYNTLTNFTRHHLLKMSSKKRILFNLRASKKAQRFTENFFSGELCMRPVSSAPTAGKIASSAGASSWRINSEKLCVLHAGITHAVLPKEI